MLKVHEVLGFGIVLAIGAVVATLMYSDLALTQATAAEKAAACVGWPRDISRQVGENFRPGPELKQPTMLAFAHAKIVLVRWDGTCMRASAEVISVPLRRLPPMAIVSAPRQSYVIYFLGGSRSEGYRFLAARAGIASLPIPRKSLGQSI